MASKSILGSLFGRDYVRSADLQYQRGRLRKAADLYLKAGRHQQAARIYDEMGETDKAVQIYTDSGHHLQAGELLLSKGDYKQAIPHFESAGAYRQAAGAALKANSLLRAARLFEQAGLYGRAAESFDKAGEKEQALRVWGLESQELKKQGAGHASERKARQLDFHRADLLSKFGRFAEAADLLMELDIPAQAAPLFMRAQRFAAAARAFMAANQPQEALAAIDQVSEGEDDIRAEIYREGGRPSKAGELYLGQGRLEDAAEAFELAEEWPKAAALWERAELYERAADLFSRVERFRDAGRCFAQLGQHEKAAASFAKAGQPQAAADAYLAAGKALEAAAHYEQAELPQAARDALQAVRPDDPEYEQACLELIPAWLDEGETGLAEERLRILREHDPAANVAPLERLYWQGRIDLLHGRLEEAESHLQQAASGRPGFEEAETLLRTVRTRIEETQSGTLRETVEVPAVSADLITPPEPAARPAKVATTRTEMPFDVEGELTPWWPRLGLQRGRDRKQQDDLMLARFPLTLLGSRSESFRRAMESVQPLRMPSILQVKEVLITGDEVLMVHEPFTGKPLAKILAKRELPPVAALSLLVQLSDALAAAHKMGVTHGWLSPSTLLVNSAARVKIIGFGLADVFADQVSSTQAYRDSEAHGLASAGPAGDMFSLGLLGVELLRAFLPADWTKAPEIEAREVTWPEEIEPLCSPSIRGVLLRCLAREPMRRPSAEELRAQLSSIGLVPGQLLAQRYEILGELGRGGMSRVYRARDRELDDVVAIKTVLSPAFGRSEDEERLLREVQICRRITHPNVVRVHDFGRFPGGVFVIMELLSGPGLDDIIREESPLALDRAKALLAEVAEALYEAHRLKIVHRDLKPANIILDRGRAKVMDFGIARTDDQNTQLTRTGQVMGSPLYMAPEQIQGRRLTGACDLYALGVLIYTLLTGREPFRGDSASTVVLKHLHEPPPDITALRSDLPEPWRELIRKLLTKNPLERPGDASKVAEIIRALPT